MNEQSAYNVDGDGRDWTNPSKCLVDKALEQWSTTRMRADNTSVVIIMIDPPGKFNSYCTHICSVTYYLHNFQVHQNVM